MKGTATKLVIPVEPQAIGFNSQETTSDNVIQLRTARLIAPRGLPRTNAAFYIGCSPRMFDGMVKNGDMPSPRMIGTKKVWDRIELDDFFESLPKPEDVGNDWDES